MERQETLQRASMLYQERQNNIVQAIENQSTFASKYFDSMTENYSYWGAYPYRFKPFHRIESTYITSTEIFNTLFEKHNQLNVLDVGGGTGQYLYSYMKEVSQGKILKPNILSLHNFQVNTDLPETYTIGNAEEVLDKHYYNESSFDLIISHMTARYFIDPLGTIQQLYRLIKKNGYIVLDTIDKMGIQEYFVDLIAYWQSRGHQILPLYTYEMKDGKLIPVFLDTLLIKRVKEDLEMPVTFNTSESIVRVSSDRPEKVSYLAHYQFSEPVPKAEFSVPQSTAYSLDLFNILKEESKRAFLKTLFQEELYNLGSIKQKEPKKVQMFLDASIRELLKSRSDLSQLAFALQASIPSALEELWDSYLSPTQKRQQAFNFLTS